MERTLSGNNTVGLATLTNSLDEEKKKKGSGMTTVLYGTVRKVVDDRNIR